MTNTPPPGSCALCGRTDQPLAIEYRTASGARATCADEASCVRARIARDVRAEQCEPDAVYRRLGISGDGRSASRDEAERLAAMAVEVRDQYGLAQVLAQAGMVHALLAVAEAITQAPSTDLVGLLDGALESIRGELASHVTGTAQ